jgi:hypothetical protein
MSEQQTALLTYMKNQQTSMNKHLAKLNAYMSEHQTGLLTSINEHLAKLNAYILQVLLSALFLSNYTYWDPRFIFNPGVFNFDQF